MKKELLARPTEKLVDDLHKKVKILPAVGYNSIEAEAWEVATSGEEMSKMESLLLDKNRKMEHELTQLKVKLNEKTSLLEIAEGKIAELTAKVNEQQKLIQKLEDDMLKGYSSKDRKGNLFDDWDLSEAGGSELSEVGFEMVDTIAEVEGISISSVSFKALLGKGWGYCFVLQDSVKASTYDF
ncbi:protein CASP-like [Alnus glutinosa]|uniref:protein CASP-like n=1 Tax=Alnus glutinosa TaxID=3517 RepID=UPI002D77C88C|nr:protein CASP-like [Alnus glutinosa]